MGCICGGPIIKDKYIGEPDILSIKTGAKNNMTKISDGDELNKQLLSINQATFVYEKRYNTFLNEYDLLEFLGKGFNNFNFRCFRNCAQSETFSYKSNSGDEDY